MSGDTMPLLCLGYASDGPRAERTPPSWCERSPNCQRHEAIVIAKKWHGDEVVKFRACREGEFDAFLQVDRGSEAMA